MAATVTALVAPSFCLRCGSEQTELVGETSISSFFSCAHCQYVWSVPRRSLAGWPVAATARVTSTLERAPARLEQKNPG